MPGFDWPRYLADDVFPALFDRLDAAFPEFGWRRSGDTWQASDDQFAHARCGARAERVFAKRGSAGYGVAGGSGESWVDYLAGKGARGEKFARAVAELARRAGLTPPDGHEMTADELAAHERARAERAQLAQEQRERDEAERAETDQQQRARALALWEAGVERHELLEAYFGRVRGIDLAALEWPWSIRFGRIYDTAPGQGALCAACDADGAFLGLQRIGIGPTGEPLRDRHRAKIKAMLGRPRGGAVLIPGPQRPDTIVLCEGVETGMAIAAASDVTVACCLSAGFLAAYEPHAQFTTVVIAADCDRSGAGQDAAEKALESLRTPDRRAEIALPGPEHAPALFSPDRLPVGKAVDWLDVSLAVGPAVVAAAIAEAADAAAVKPPTDWGDKKLMPPNDLHRARFYLLDRAAPPRGQRRNAGLHLVTIAGAAYEFTGRSWRYLPGRTEPVRREVRRWAAEQWWELRTYRRNGESVTEPKPLSMSKSAVESVVAAVFDEAMVLVPEGQAMTRLWLRPAFDARGRADWSARAFDRIDTPEGRPPASSVIALANGLLDVEAWRAGTVRLMPHTPLFFNTTEVPWALPELPEALDDETLQDRIDELCPEWLDLLATKLRSHEDRGEAMRELQKWFGYVLTPDIAHQYGNIGVLCGPPGTGKSTVANVLDRLIGTANVVHSRLDKLTDGPHMASWIGKLLAVFSEANAGTKSDKELSSEILKAISGGDPISLRRLYEGEMPAQQLTTRLLLLVNEMPDLPDRSKALQRRMIVWDMSVRHRTEDTTLLERLLAPRAMAGVLLWALLGLRYLERDGAFLQPASGRAALEVFMAAASLLDEFVEDYLEMTDDDADFESGDLIYNAFRWYWERVRHRTHEPMGDTHFFRQLYGLLRAHGWTGERSREGNRRGYTRIRVVPGATLGYEAAPGPHRS